MGFTINTVYLCESTFGTYLFTEYTVRLQVFSHFALQRFWNLCTWYRWHSLIFDNQFVFMMYFLRKLELVLFSLEFYGKKGFDLWSIILKF